MSYFHITGNLSHKFEGIFLTEHYKDKQNISALNHSYFITSGKPPEVRK